MSDVEMALTWSQRNPERVREYQRRYYERNRQKRLEFNRRYRERLKRGEIQLPELDWAICARGGSEAQAKAHQRRGEDPCPACLRAQSAAQARRRTVRLREGRSR